MHNPPSPNRASNFGWLSNTFLVQDHSAVILHIRKKNYNLFLPVILFLQTDLVPVSYLSDRFRSKEIVMKHHGLGSQGTLPIAQALIVCTLT